MLAVLFSPFLFLVGASVFSDLTGSAPLGLFLFVLLLVGVCCGSSKSK